ncbi:hypothetical protein E2562_032937 [Oryza meyeriana var. granulata]|uniref:Uncharacterized protein n=1 Tax=Oryza meyeriana var. granulata TaxID=110450 RepID=A0A6G1DR25_9ORYZ|nr:hypothetical protein E2562_032937 [Oryza meyeriana var. granulata]
MGLDLARLCRERGETRRGRYRVYGIRMRGTVGEGAGSNGIDGPSHSGLLGQRMGMKLTEGRLCWADGLGGEAVQGLG